MWADIFAVKDIASRVEVKTPPVATEVEQPWWEIELASNDALAEESKFSGSDKYAMLPASEQKRLKSEAGVIYDYCSRKQLFSSLRECRCVAGKFIDARLAQEETDRLAAEKRAAALAAACEADPEQCPPPPKPESEMSGVERFRERSRARTFIYNGSSRMELIAIAGKVADLCPYKAGAAAFIHGKCMGRYETSLGEADLKAFCDCRADEFAERFMEEPDASILNVTRLGTSAMLACKKKGVVSPMR